MLSKLVKHEFRATGRILLPLMAAMLVLAGLSNLALRSVANGLPSTTLLRILFGLLIFTFVTAVIATAVMSLVIMVSRFYRNYLKDEGYLMFTLPVSTHALIWSKLIVSLLWFIIVGIVITLVGSLTMWNSLNTDLITIIRDTFPSWSELQSLLERYQLQGPLSHAIILTLAAMLLGGITCCLHFYASMALGHMFSKNKIFLSIVFFVLISMLFSVTGMGAGFSGFNEMGIYYNSLDVSGPEGFRRLFLPVYSAILTRTLIFEGLQAVLLYVATWLGLKRGLNLE